MDKQLPDDFDPYGTGMTIISGGVSGGRQWLMQLLQGLILAGIVALITVTWNLQGSVTELRVTLSEREKQNDRDIDRIDATLARHDQRLTDLERGQSTRNADSDYRQKR